MSALPTGTRTDALRRELGPTAWCALECLVERADTAAVAVASVRSLAEQLGVAKNTAHRALAALVHAGIVEAVQARGSDGRFHPGTYRLHLEGLVPTPPPQEPRKRVTARAIADRSQQLSLLSQA